jgi:hypothetical protein
LCVNVVTSKEAVVNSKKDVIKDVIKHILNNMIIFKKYLAFTHYLRLIQQINNIVIEQGYKDIENFLNNC